MVSSSLQTSIEILLSYLKVGKDLTRVMNRLKVLYHSRDVACAGTRIYTLRHRSGSLSKTMEAGVHSWDGSVHQQLNGLPALCQAMRRALLAEGRKHGGTKLLQIPDTSLLGAGLSIASLQTSDRFRAKQQLGTSRGLAIEMRNCGEYGNVDGRMRHPQKPAALRGLNRNNNHDLRWIFMSAVKATNSASSFHKFCKSLFAKGIRPSLVRLTLACKIAAITLTIWKRGVHFGGEHLEQQAA